MGYFVCGPVWFPLQYFSCKVGRTIVSYIYFPAIVFFPPWHSKYIFRILTVLGYGSILLVLLACAWCEWTLLLPEWVEQLGEVVIFCISCSFGLGTECAVRWHMPGQIAALSLLPRTTEWYEVEEGTMRQGTWESVMPQGTHHKQTVVTTVFLQHHSSVWVAFFCWRLIWSNSWCSGLTIIFSQFISSFFRVIFRFGLIIACAYLVGGSCLSGGGQLALAVLWQISICLEGREALEELV